MVELAVLVKGYPRLSETFIAQELKELENLGFQLQIYSLRRPHDSQTHPIHQEIHSPVYYLPEYIYRQPIRVFRSWRTVRNWSGYYLVWKSFCRDLRRDCSPNRIRRFAQAMVLAAEMPRGIRHLYVHFMHTPASVASYAAQLRGITWSISAHAKDIWTTAAWELEEKLSAASWCVTCSQTNLHYLRQFTARKDNTHLIYHGLNLEKLPSPKPRCKDKSPLTLLSVGRAVNKKGYQDLLQGLSLLPRDVLWRFIHIGAGNDLKKLQSQAIELGIASQVEWRGSQTQSAVFAAYRQADIFILPCRIAEDGDRDGLPNVLLEAASQALPCISTRISAIPELIEDRVNGILVGEKNPLEIAEALTLLIGNEALRHRLGAEAKRTVEQRFSCKPGIAKLAELLSLQGIRR